MEAVAVKVTGSMLQVGLFPLVWATDTVGVNEPVKAIARLLPVLVPQLLFGITVILPVLVPKFTVMAFVLVPLLMVAPEGRFHVYPVAPLTGFIL